MSGYGINDLISRQAAINTVHKNYDTILDFKSDGHTVADSFEDILNALPSAQLEPQWIPVSERLPERDGEYLVSTLGIIYGRTYTQVGEFSTATKSWIVYDSEYGYVPLYDVLAWMPLPEPWKDGEE